MSEQDLKQEFEEKVAELESEDVVEEIEEQDDDTPQGFLTLEQYIEKGGDPDMYRGKKAFSQYHERLKSEKEAQREARELKQKLASIESGMSAMAQSIQEQAKADAQKMIDDANRKMAEAKESYDFDEYERQKNIAAQAEKKLQQAPKQQKAPKEPDFIQEFRARNAIIDHSSDEFDEDINLLVENRFNTRAAKLNPNTATQEDYEELLNAVYTQVTSKLAPKVEKQPKKAPSTRQVSKNNVETQSTSIARLSSSERQMYDVIKDTSGEDAAKRFLTNMTKKV